MLTRKIEGGQLRHQGQTHSIPHSRAGPSFQSAETSSRKPVRPTASSMLLSQRQCIAQMNCRSLAQHDTTAAAQATSDVTISFSSPTSHFPMTAEIIPDFSHTAVEAKDRLLIESVCTKGGAFKIGSPQLHTGEMGMRSSLPARKSKTRRSGPKAHSSHRPRSRPKARRPKRLIGPTTIGRPDTERAQSLALESWALLISAD